MELIIGRSKSAKTKLFGGSEVTFAMQIRAVIPADEMALLMAHDEIGSSFVPDELSELISDRNVEGPSNFALDALVRGIEYKAKSVYTSVTDLPQRLALDYQARLGRALVREQWGGASSMTVSCSSITLDGKEV